MRLPLLSSTLAILATFLLTAFGCAPKQSAAPSPAPAALVESQPDSENADDEELAQGQPADESADAWGDEEQTAEEEPTKTVEEESPPPQYDDDSDYESGSDEPADEATDDEGYDDEW